MILNWDTPLDPLVERPLLSSQVGHKKMNATCVFVIKFVHWRGKNTGSLTPVTKHKVEPPIYIILTPKGPRGSKWAFGVFGQIPITSISISYFESFSIGKYL